jgi:hypothetical protein
MHVRAGLDPKSWFGDKMRRRMAPTEEMAEPETDPSFYARSLPQTPMISFGIGSTYALPRAVAGARTSIHSNVIDFLPLRFRLVAAGGTVQSFCPTDGHLGNVG